MVNYHGKLSEYDLFLELEAFSEGRSCHAWRCFGAHADEVDGQSGCTFRVWAPNAKQVCVFGDFNGWDETAAPLEKVEGGIWQGFIPGLKRYDTYKYAIQGPDGKVVEKGTLCKMARGEMVRWLAETGTAHPDGLPAFQGLGYRYDPDRSTGARMVFLKTAQSSAV